MGEDGLNPNQASLQSNAPYAKPMHYVLIAVRWKGVLRRTCTATTDCFNVCEGKGLTITQSTQRLRTLSMGEYYALVNWPISDPFARINCVHNGYVHSYRIVYLLAVIINYKIDDTLQNISTKQQKYTKCT